MALIRSSGRQLEDELEELKGVAERLEIEVREEELLREVGYRARSGACRLRDHKVLIIDRKLPVNERLEILVRELRKQNLDGIYLSPALRRRVNKGDGSA